MHEARAHICGGVLLIFWLVLLATSGYGADPNPEITHFRQLFTLSPEQAAAGLPVRIKSIIVCYDANWGQMYAHDGDLAQYFSPQKFSLKLEAGQAVEITGLTTRAEGANSFTNLNLRVLGSAVLLQAKALELSQLGQDFGQWIETSGRVRVVETSRDRLGLVLNQNNQSCLVYVMGVLPTNRFSWLLDRKVKIRGINASQSEGGKLSSALVFVPGMNEIKLIDDSVSDPFPGPVVSIHSVLNRLPGSWTNNRIHLNGTVTAWERGQSVQISEPTGEIRAKIRQETEAKTGQRVDLWGYVTITPRETILTDAYFEVTPQGGEIAALPNNASATNASPGEKIWRVSEIMRLSASEVESKIPIRLRGVVTFADAEWSNGFLQDDSGGIYFPLRQPEVRAGQYIELTGRTRKGAFAPDLRDPHAQVLFATNLPTPIRVELKEMMNGHLDANWVQMEAVLQSMKLEWGHLYLNLMSREGPFKAIVPVPADSKPPMEWIDALVRIQGACTSEVNARGQLVGISLNVPSLQQIQVLEPARSNRLTDVAISISSVGKYDPERKPGHQIKITGVVTLRLSGTGFYVQDATAGIRINTQENSEIAVGDQVEVVGFPALNENYPYIDRAVSHKIGAASPPLPIPLTAKQLLASGTNADMVVCLVARLLRDIVNEADPELIVQDGNIIFSARIRGAASLQKRTNLREGSWLSLTGVCAMQGNKDNGNESFRLLLRNLSDIQVVKSAAWWNTRNVSILAGALLAVVLLGTGWNLMLRHEVARQAGLVAEKLRQEAALEERYRQLVESSSDLVWEVDRVNVCTFASHHIWPLLGYTPSEAVGKCLFDFMPRKESLRAAELFDSRARCRESFHNEEIASLHKDGHTLALEYTGVPIVDSQGQWQGYRGIARDISERKRAEIVKADLEAQLRQAQKMEAIGTLAGGIAHDFNNILGIIIPYVDLAKRYAAGNAELQASLLEIGLAARRAADLVKQMLAFSRQANVNLQPIQLQPVIKEVLQMLRSVLPSSIELMTQVDPAAPFVLADPVQIHQILLNLCTNATHAMKGTTGRIYVKLEPFTGDETFFLQHPDLKIGAFAKLSVRDTGHGMNAATIKRIFEPFFTTKGPKEGTGLGLAVVHGIVKDHKGCIQVTSEPGHGAIFEIYLPACESPHSQEGKELQVSIPLGHGERILFVDDEKGLAVLAEKILRQNGYVTTSFVVALEALEKFRQNPADFDLVITDLTMPKITGLEFTRKILDIRSDIPIILTSGFSNMSPEELRRVGIASLVNKPIEANTLAMAVHQTLTDARKNMPQPAS